MLIVFLGNSLRDRLKEKETEFDFKWCLKFSWNSFWKYILYFNKQTFLFFPAFQRFCHFEGGEFVIKLYCFNNGKTYLGYIKSTWVILELYLLEYNFLEFTKNKIRLQFVGSLFIVQ